MLEFEWYSEKERINIEKHGFDLETVKKVFSDPFRIEQYDEAHSGLEDRWQTMGMVNGVLFVVYTERQKVIRVISTRDATPEERRIYYGTSNKGYWFIP
jgi:uncharacterized DUF497 family protein